MKGKTDDLPPKRSGSSTGPGKMVAPGDLAAVGFQFAGAILLFVYVGQWLDRRLGTAPWLLILGVFLGAGLGFYSMYHKLMVTQSKGDKSGGPG